MLVEDKDVSDKKKGKAAVITYKRGFDAMGKTVIVECAGSSDVENRSGGVACIVLSVESSVVKIGPGGRLIGA